MNLQKCPSLHALSLSIAAAIALPGTVQADEDFGVLREQLLLAHSTQLFGIVSPVPAASTEDVDQATAEANPLSLVTLAQGLHARVVSASADLGPNVDMMTLWPQNNPTHLIVCNEQGPDAPGIQRVRLSDGAVETILTGTRSCDPAHATPWGTVVVAEEAGGSGSMLEIIDPLNTTDVVYDRDAGTFSGADAANVAERPAVGHLSFEGVVVFPNGIVYYGDENRPSAGTPGGAYFKFVPTTPWAGGAPIASLAQSPLTGGSVHGLRLGMRSGGTDYGQGAETGRGTWVPVTMAYDGNLRAEAANLELTGYYRPEDASADENALERGEVRFCANNTGNEANDRSWGNTICVTDGTLEEAAANTATPDAQLFVVGTKDLSMMDNIAYQPGRGNWIIQTDRDAVGMTPADGEGYPFNNTIWSCTEDGADVDSLSDGCARVVTLNDLDAESTGGFFDPSGRHYFVSIQHNSTGHGVILEITGWR
jgi:secreted PhoX family phosphatase